MGGQKKRRKRSIGGTVTISGFALAWRLRSEPQWSTEGGHEGLSISVERTDGAFRELILEYPIPKGRKMRIGGRVFEMPGGFPQRPKLSPKIVENNIRSAMQGGWDPASRGKPHIFQVPAIPG